VEILRTVAELRVALALNPIRAFVPTMGNLHEGHLDLVRQARARVPAGQGLVIASIFVNRLQFGPKEDFDTYPRTFERDCEALELAGCDAVFAPEERELYPEPQAFTVQPPAAIANILEGEHRPGFFTGVATVVHKLFNVVQPQVALFGKKDYQQLLVIRHMVRQMALPIEIVGVETRRAADGLALSSRNGYLRPEDRQEAGALSAALRQLAQDTRRAIDAGDFNALPTMEAAAMAVLRDRGWRPDYLTVRRRADLLPPTSRDEALVVLGAAKLGTTRLIDNFEF
jgi:pantoate--beta-alanine ligase